MSRKKLIFIVVFKMLTYLSKNRKQIKIIIEIT